MGFPFGRRGRTPQELLQLAREGDREARERLIDSFTPFILRVASQSRGRYVQVGEDEEVSIGMLAFNEAIDHFDDRRGKNFLAFAEQVIRRRLIDHYRRERRGAREVNFSELKDQENPGYPLEAEVRMAVEEHRRVAEAEDQREEILRYRDLLAAYGISLPELVRISPKHRDARDSARKVARVLAEDPELAEHLRRLKELPLKELSSRVAVSRKTLERQRKYIIALALIAMEDFDHLRGYVEGGG